CRGNWMARIATDLLTDFEIASAAIILELGLTGRQPSVQLELTHDLVISAPWSDARAGVYSVVHLDDVVDGQEVPMRSLLLAAWPTLTVFSTCSKTGSCGRSL